MTADDLMAELSDHIRDVLGERLAARVGGEYDPARREVVLSPEGTVRELGSGDRPAEPFVHGALR